MIWIVADSMTTCTPAGGAPLGMLHCCRVTSTAAPGGEISRRACKGYCCRCARVYRETVARSGLAAARARCRDRLACAGLCDRDTLRPNTTGEYRRHRRTDRAGSGAKVHRARESRDSVVVCILRRDRDAECRPGRLRAADVGDRELA